MSLDPKDALNGVSVDYNWTGWATLVRYLNEWGVDTSEFKGANDGDPISAETCHKVAKAIEDHMHELPTEDRGWLADHPRQWRYLAKWGGCAQH